MALQNKSVIDGRVGWNSEGYEGLVPKYAGGMPSKLHDEQKEMLKITLNKRDDWTTEEIREMIYENFNVTYSAKRVREILKGFGLKYGKSYCLKTQIERLSSYLTILEHIGPMLS